MRDLLVERCIIGFGLRDQLLIDLRAARQQALDEARRIDRLVFGDTLLDVLQTLLGAASR